MAFNSTELKNINDWLHARKIKCQACGTTRWNVLPDFLCISVGDPCTTIRSFVAAECVACGLSIFMSPSKVGVKAPTTP
jgi:hypothetical protein